MAIAVIVVVAVITVVVAIIIVVVIVAVAVTITITVVTGCCHCYQDNKFLTVFVMSHVFCNRKQVTINNAHVHGQKVIGRANQRLGKLLVGLPEDLCFHAFFGVSAEVAVEAWEMMADHSCLPQNPEFFHYLLALAFMQTYPTNNTTLSTLLGGKDPKKVYKYVWLYIQSLFGLTKVVVR